MLLREQFEKRESEHKNEGMKKKDKRRGAMRSPYDVNGSYTGTPEEGGKPVQDADDL